MASATSDQKLSDAFCLWLREKGLQVPLLVEPRTREGAGRGLFVSRPISANETVLKVPSAALMNIRTLRAFYKDFSLEGHTANPHRKIAALNGTQLISLHLTLHRPTRHGERSTDPTFGPYVSVLPREFDAHPLSWLIKQEFESLEEGDTAIEQRLLEHLPPSVSSELTAVSKRFQHDWKVVKDSWEAHSKFLERPNADANKTIASQTAGQTLIYPDFLWAWLIVNTRSLYLRLFNRDLPLSNLTLCPLIDFANHTTSADTHLGAFPQIHLVNEARPSNLNKFMAPGAAHDMVFMSPPDRELNEGEEVFLRYGGHCNRTLFVEYGFVDEHGDSSFTEVNVDDLMDAMFRNSGEFEACRDVLKREGYTEKWCLYLSPAPPHPSFTLISALRLLNSWAEEKEKLEVSFTHVLAGQLSERVEALVRQNLERLCQTVVERSKAALKYLREAEERFEGFSSKNTPPWSSWAVGNVKELWLEESKVARAVLSSIESGVEISDFP